MTLTPVVEQVPVQVIGIDVRRLQHRDAVGVPPAIGILGNRRERIVPVHPRLVRARKRHICVYHRIRRVHRHIRRRRGRRADALGKSFNARIIFCLTTSRGHS